MKKGSLISDAIIWFWRIILVILVSLFIYMITFYYLKPDIQTEQLELKILTTKLLYSDSCIKYKNPGEINLEKFTDAHLKNCYTKSNFGYKLNLTDLNNKQIKTAKSLTQQQETQIQFCLEPSKCISTKEYILYFQDNKLKPGILIIEAIKNV